MTDICNGDHIRSLTGSGKHCAYAAFKLCDLSGNGAERRVGQTCIEEAVLFKVKQLSEGSCTVIFEGSALHDRNHAGFAVFRVIACLQAFRVDMVSHFQFSFKLL